MLKHEPDFLSPERSFRHNQSEALGLILGSSSQAVHRRLLDAGVSSSLVSSQASGLPALAVVLLGAITAAVQVQAGTDPLTLAWLSTFALFFSHYVFTPQMNLILLPFFALVPITKRYWEFLAFDVLTAAIIVVGFSPPLQIVGITYSVDRFTYFSPVQWMAIARSAWLGKFLLWDGVAKMISRAGSQQTAASKPGSMKQDTWAAPMKDTDGGKPSRTLELQPGHAPEHAA